MQISKELKVSEQHTYSLSIRRIRREEQTLMQTAKAGNPGTSDWPWCSLSDWKENNRPVERPGGYVNSASMSVLSRRIMATEWARALGRKPVDPRVIALEQEAKLHAAKQEEERQRVERERKMLVRFCSTLSSEGILTGSGTDKWDLGGVEFAVAREGEDWDIRIESSRPNLYMRRCGWGDLPTVYHVRVDEDLNIIAYSRETAETSTPREG